MIEYDLLEELLLYADSLEMLITRLERDWPKGPATDPNCLSISFCFSFSMIKIISKMSLSMKDPPPYSLKPIPPTFISSGMA